MSTQTFAYQSLSTTSNNRKARKAIDRKQKVVIVVRGWEAFLLYSALQPFLANATGGPGQAVPATASVRVPVAVGAGAPAVVGATVRAPQSGAPTQNLTGVEVALGIAIVVGAVAAVGLVVVAAICTYGMDRGYKMDIKHRVSSKGDHRLDLILVPPK